MDIRKIRYDGSQVTLDLRRKNDQDWENVSLKSKDQPRQEFTDALSNLKGDFRYFLELPKETDEKLEIRGINVGEQGSTKTFQFVGGLRISAGFTSLNTPTLHEQNEELQSGPSVLTKEQRERIETFLEQAEEYYFGAREQLAFPEIEDEEVAEPVH